MSSAEESPMERSIASRRGLVERMLRLGRDERDIAEISGMTVGTIRFFAGRMRDAQAESDADPRLVSVRASDGSVICNVVRRQTRAAPPRKMPPGRLAPGQRKRPPPREIGLLRDELVRDFFTMSDERRTELRTRLETWCREVNPRPLHDRRSTKFFSTEKTLRMAADTWGMPERVMMEMIS